MNTPIQKPKGPTAAPVPKDKRRSMMVVVGGLAVVAVAVGAFAIWASSHDRAPQVNADTKTLAAFVSSSDYLELPFDRQSVYMKVLEDREDAGELKEMHKAGTIPVDHYRAAIQEAWLGEQLKRSEKYASMPPGDKPKYIQELLEKKAKKKSGKAKTGGGSGGGSRGGDEDGVEIKRDASTSQARLGAWPADARRKWEEFNTAYDAAKAARDALAAEAAGGGGANP